MDGRRMGSVEEESLHYKGSERHLMLAHRCGPRARAGARARARGRAGASPRARLVVRLIR